MSSRVRTLTRRNLILTVVIVVLGVILAIRPNTVTSVDKDDLPAVFPGFEQDQIRRIELSRRTPGGTEAVRLELGSGGTSWLLGSHFQYPTQAGPARLLDAIAGARSRGDVTRRQETFDRYAGEEGWIDIVLTDLQGREALRFAIGKRVYPETFLKIGGGAEARIVKALNITPGAARTDVRSWIETRLWPELSATNVVRIDVEQRRDERTITLIKRGVPASETGMPVPPKPDGAEKPDEGWYMASPRPGEGRPLATEDLLRQFTGILVEDIVAGDVVGDAAKTYGFDDPELVVTLHHKTGAKVTKHVLVVGAKVPDREQSYVQRKGARWVFTVGASSLSRMRQMPDEFREPDPEPEAPKDDDPKKDDEPAKDDK